MQINDRNAVELWVNGELVFQCSIVQLDYGEGLSSDQQLSKSNVSQTLNPIDLPEHRDVLRKNSAGDLSVFKMTSLYQNMISSEFRNLTCAEEPRNTRYLD